MFQIIFYIRILNAIFHDGIFTTIEHTSLGNLAKSLTCLYSGSLNLDDDDQLLVQNMNEDDDAEETAELLKDLFPDFSYVKRKRKPKKD